MNSLDYATEMIYGRKHLKLLQFDKTKYNFVKVVTDLFNCELSKIHNWSNTKYDFFGPDMFGKDSHTVYHQHFYKKLDSNWKEMNELYDNFVKNIILPYLNLNEALVQVYPTFRVQLPDNVAICVEHYDSDEKHNHPTGEINFIIALTDMFETNTV